MMREWNWLDIYRETTPTCLKINSLLAISFLWWSPNTITVHNEVAKVMFLQACVCPQGGVCLSGCWDTPPSEQTSPRQQTPPTEQMPPQSRHPPGAHTPFWEHTSLEQTPGSRHPPGSRPPRSRHPPEQTPPPPPRYGHCCGRYASYWNAFFLDICHRRLHHVSSSRCHGRCVIVFGWKIIPFQSQSICFSGKILKNGKFYMKFECEM